MTETVYLASRSPRRRELLRQIGIPFTPLSVTVDETPGAGERAADYVCRLAREKAQAGWRKVAAGGVVIGADTAVVIGGDILGKPVDRDHAAAMLARLSGREHEVMSAVCLAGEGGCETALSVSVVRFAALTPATIARYIATGEADDKAGAYAVQGLAAVFVEHLQGSYSGVMGLPLYETAQLFKRLGVATGLPNE